MLISDTADLRPTIKLKNNNSAQNKLFPLISDTADLRPTIKLKNNKSNQEASSENAALKDGALNH